MNGKQWVGEKALSFKAFSAAPPITQVLLAADESGETVYVAGTEGYSISVYCPWATQQMADDLLEKAQGFQYQGFEASMAALPGSAERGDGVNACGVYGMLADRTIYFNPGMNSDISAPWEEEVNHEFQYVSPIKQDIIRQVGQAQAELRVELDQITATVQDQAGNISQLQQTATSLQSQITGVNGEVSTLTQTLDGLTITTSTGTTMIRGSVIETGSLVLTGTISWGDFDSAVQSEINNISSAAKNAYDLADANRLPGYITSTKITRATIESPSITGGTITGGSVYGGKYYNLTGDAYMEVGGSAQGDFTLWGSGSNRVFYVYDNVGSTSFSAYGVQFLTVGNFGTPSAEAKGIWDFSAANTIGIHATFA